VADPVSFRRLLKLTILELLLVCFNLYIYNQPGLLYCPYVLSCNRRTINSHIVLGRHVLIIFICSVHTTQLFKQPFFTLT